MNSKETGSAGKEQGPVAARFKIFENISCDEGWSGIFDLDHGFDNQADRSHFSRRFFHVAGFRSGIFCPGSRSK
ncbi:MAG: hypothetical protein WCH98_10280, partial [Verrucomicrobiota bacterium]